MDFKKEQASLCSKFKSSDCFGCPIADSWARGCTSCNDMYRRYPRYVKSKIREFKSKN